MDNNNKANLLNVTYGKYLKLCEKNMTRNVNNNTLGNTNQSAIEMQVKTTSLIQLWSLSYYTVFQFMLRVFPNLPLYKGF